MKTNIIVLGELHNDPNNLNRNDTNYQNLQKLITKYSEQQKGKTGKVAFIIEDLDFIYQTQSDPELLELANHAQKAGLSLIATDVLSVNGKPQPNLIYNNFDAKHEQITNAIKNANTQQQYNLIITLCGARHALKMPPQYKVALLSSFNDDASQIFLKNVVAESARELSTMETLLQEQKEIENDVPPANFGILRTIANCLCGRRDRQHLHQE